MLTEQDLRSQIQTRIDRDGLEAAAEALKVGTQYLSDVARGLHPVSTKMAKRLGYEMVPMFREVEC